MSKDALLEIAGREEENRWEETNERLRYSVEYAQAGIKGLFLANGGAIIALLTFVGNAQKIVEPEAIFWAFIWYILGLTLTLICYFSGYLSQTYLMNSVYCIAMQSRSDRHDLGEQYDAKSWETKGEQIIRVGLVAAILALLAFAVGSMVALDGIT